MRSTGRATSSRSATGRPRSKVMTGPTRSPPRTCQSFGACAMCFRRWMRGRRRTHCLRSAVDEVPVADRAVIVGSGAGASIAALELAHAGWDVVMLERGPRYVGDLDGERPSKRFSNDELKASRY